MITRPAAIARYILEILPAWKLLEAPFTKHFKSGYSLFLAICVFSESTRQYNIANQHIAVYATKSPVSFFLLTHFQKVQNCLG